MSNVIDFSADDGAQHHITPAHLKENTQNLTPIQLVPLPKPKHQDRVKQKTLKDEYKKRFDPKTVGETIVDEQAKDGIVYNSCSNFGAEAGTVEINEKKKIVDKDGQTKIVHVMKKKNKQVMTKADLEARKKMGRNALENTFEQAKKFGSDLVHDPRLGNQSRPLEVPYPMQKPQPTNFGNSRPNNDFISGPRLKSFAEMEGRNCEPCLRRL